MFLELASPHPPEASPVLNLELLPRLEPDHYCETLEEAVAEVERRRASGDLGDSVTRMVESPFGGFRVFTVSRTMAVELFTALAEQGVAALPDSPVGGKEVYR